VSSSKHCSYLRIIKKLREATPGVRLPGERGFWTRAAGCSREGKNNEIMLILDIKLLKVTKEAAEADGRTAEQRQSLLGTIFKLHYEASGPGVPLASRFTF